MRRTPWVKAPLCVLIVSAYSVQPPRPSADDAFARFYHASSQGEVTDAADRIVASGIGFDEALARLRRGRTYSQDVQRGFIQKRYHTQTGDYSYAVDVPAGYDAGRKYQVRVQLHGGVARRDASTPLSDSREGRLPGVEQIYVVPTAWRDAPWWSGAQATNVHAILEEVKRTYNVDENRIVLAGVSDGGTGTFYMAMRHTTPFASFLSLNGFILVLRNETTDADGDLFPNNLIDKPWFVVNGGRDPMYPTRTVDPYIEHLRSHGVDVTYRPQPNAAHDTTWWPEVRDAFERFVADHPRVPLPDRLTWQSGPPNVPARAHWLVIDRLDRDRRDEPSLEDVNRMPTASGPDFGIRGSGPRINRVVKDSNAEQLGLRAGDVVAAINSQPVSPDTDVAGVFESYPQGRPVILTVVRNTERVQLRGRYAPTVLPSQAGTMFPAQHESGRVDLVRTGNTIAATTRGVAAFTLLLSPDQFDLTRSVVVVVNGRTVVNGVIKPDLSTLLKWAAGDNDRTMLFAAELHVTVPR